MTTRATSSQRSTRWRRARTVPDQMVIDGESRSLADTLRRGHFSDQVCARDCARDIARRVETGGRCRLDANAAPPACRGQLGGERPSGTAETGVVCLITQRSQVQILPPLPGQRPGGTCFLAFCTLFVIEFVSQRRGVTPRRSGPLLSADSTTTEVRRRCPARSAISEVHLDAGQRRVRERHDTGPGWQAVGAVGAVDDGRRQVGLRCGTVAGRRCRLHPPWHHLPAPC